MKYLLVATLALFLLSAPSTGQSAARPDAAPARAAAPELVNHTNGSLHDMGGGFWVTIFHLHSGLMLIVPHDPALDAVTLISLPPSGPILVPDADLGAWIDGNLALPATAGSGSCWAIPYGPPNPDGTWPVQPTITKITGHGGAMSQAVMDYKAKVEAAMEEGAFPVPPSSC